MSAIKTRLRIRGCSHEPPHASFDECGPENDAWMFRGSNVPVAEPAPPGKRCPFATSGMQCVLEEGHKVDPVFGGHHLVAARYIDSEESWSEARRAAFSAQYRPERDNGQAVSSPVTRRRRDEEDD